MTDLMSSTNRVGAPAGPPRPMRLFVTGGSGVLGRALLPLADEAGHTVLAPRHADLDLFDPDAVRWAVRGADAVLHLAARIRGLDELDRPESWRDNDRLRAEASAILVNAARATTTSVYVQPTVTFVYPPGAPADEETPIGEVSPILASALVAERNATGSGSPTRGSRRRRDGGRATDARRPRDRAMRDRARRAVWGDQAKGAVVKVFVAGATGATVHVADAARALLAALTLPAGIYNVCRDGERVSNARLSQAARWRPRH